MAGNVRQPIDIASLERYITANVPEIKVPLDVKQVCRLMFGRGRAEACSLDTKANRRQVWLRTVESDVSVDRQRWQEIRHEEETSGSALVKGTKLQIPESRPS
jgi:hypothetical protein